MIAHDELVRLLKAEETDTLERKESLSDEDKIQRAMIAFANDLAGRGGGKIIIGQKDDKTVVGLRIGGDEAQRKISDIALNRCHPSVPIVIDISEYDGKSIAIVDVRASSARPHFRGQCIVRQGSTNKTATEAEISLLRSAAGSPKLRQLLQWQQEGKTTVTALQNQRGMYSTVQVELIEVTETFVTLKYNPSFIRTQPLEGLGLGYDYQRQRPQIAFDRTF